MTRINRAGHHRAERHRAAVIKIRYRGVDELSPGLHATAEHRGRVVTVYLLAGLTAAERNAALRRLWLSGRRGYGPRLPAMPLAFARFADRIRTTVARTSSVFRTHPAGASGPVIVMSAGAIAFLVLSALSIRILRELPPAGPSVSDMAPAASAVTGPNHGSSPPPAYDPGGAEDRVLTMAQTRPNPMPPLSRAASPDLSGQDSGVTPGTGTGNPGTGSGPGTGTGAGGGTTAAAGGGSTPHPAVALPGLPPVPAPVSPSGPASAPAAGPTSPSAASTVTAPAPVAVAASVPASVPVAPSASVSASVAPSVSVSASVAPSVSVSAAVPMPAGTAAPVTVSVSAAVSASLPETGSAAAGGAHGSAQSPAVTAHVSAGACVAGVCLGG